LAVSTIALRFPKHFSASGGSPHLSNAIHDAPAPRLKNFFRRSRPKCQSWHAAPDDSVRRFDAFLVLLTENAVFSAPLQPSSSRFLRDFAKFFPPFFSSFLPFLPLAPEKRVLKNG